MQIDTTGPDHHQQWEDYCAMMDATQAFADMRAVAQEAQAEVARLRAENERLRAALEEIGAEELDEGDDDPTEPTFGARYYVNLARKALAALAPQ